MKIAIKKFNVDSSFFLFIRYFSFSVASFISILLNVFFFQSLDTGSFGWILFGMSVLLESAKVSTILTRNIFSALYEKTLNQKIRIAKYFFLVMYLSLALLSVSAAAGFSYFVTETVDTSKQIEVRNFEDKIEMVDSLRERIESLSDDSDITLSEYIPFQRAQERLETARTSLADAQNAFDIANSNWMSVRSEPDNSNYQRFLDARTAANTALNTQRTNVVTREREITQVQAEFNDRGEGAATRLAELDEEFNLLIRALDIQMTTATLALPLVSRARLATTEIQQELGLLQDQIVRDKGMQIIFDDLGEFLDKTPKSIKLIVLLFVAFLIELTIFQSSPDIRVNRRVLYFFRSWIPNNVDVNELLQKFDDELERFTNVESESVQEVVSVQSEQVVEEPIKVRRTRQPKEAPVVVEAAATPKRTRRKKVDVEQQFPEGAFAKAVESTSKDLDRLFPADAPEAQARPLAEIEAQLKQWDEEPIEDVQAKLTQIISEDRELDAAEQARFETKKVVIDANKKLHYRFGETSESVARKLVQFVEACVDSKGQFVKNPTDAAKAIAVSTKLKDVFLRRLKLLQFDKKPLIEEDEGVWYANFSAEQIVAYATEILE